MLPDLVEGGQCTDPQFVALAADAVQLAKVMDVDDTVIVGDAEPKPIEQLGAAGDDGGTVVERT